MGMRNIMGKKGAAHFEMIISFVFFVGFVFFLFMVLKPQDTSVLSNSVIAALYDTFEEEVRTNLSTMTLKRTGAVGDCFEVDLPWGIFEYEMKDKGSRVTTLDDSVVSSALVSGGVLRINSNDDPGFFRVALSPEFDDGVGVVGCEPFAYELGGIVEREVISYSALESVATRYLNDYEGLREDLRVPAIFDFAIVPDSLPIAMEPQFGVPSSVEVMARDYVAEVLKSDGTLINERFTLKIW